MRDFEIFKVVRNALLFPTQKAGRLVKSSTVKAVTRGFVPHTGRSVSGQTWALRSSFMPHLSNPRGEAGRQGRHHVRGNCGTRSPDHRCRLWPEPRGDRLAPWPNRTSLFP